MTIAALYSMDKEKVGDVELPDDVFSANVNAPLIHQAVCAHLANCRQGTASTKTRREVRGGGKKPYKQKGTGRARHGSIRSPIFVGGGVTFGPRPKDWHIVMPKKQRREALRSVLSMKNKDGTIFVLDKFISSDGKTAKMAKFFEKWELASGVIVTHCPDEKTIRAIRNIPNVKMVIDKDLSVYDVVRYKSLLLTKDAIGNIASRLVK